MQTKSLNVENNGQMFNDEDALEYSMWMWHHMEWDGEVMTLYFTYGQL